MIVPTLKFEQQLWNSGNHCVVGVDEVGRGALAGPVVAAAVLFDCHHQPILGVRDSKTLSTLQKSRLSPQIQSSCIEYAIGEVAATEVDTVGIVAATALAMQRALEKISMINHVLIDGTPFKNATFLNTYQKTFIVKGDSLSYSIAAASILAKVYRDNYMQQLSSSLPHYGWDKNVGYGTRHHLSALKKYGPSIHHRLCFLQ